MNLTVKNRVIEIELEPLERLWSCHLGESIEIPLAAIEHVALEQPQTTWRELRAPGTYWPGLIKAGTYYSDLGRAFWSVRPPQDCICIDLAEGSYYRRIVLGSPLAAQWLAELQAIA